MKETYQPTNEDLIRWMGTWSTEEDVNAAGYYFGGGPQDRHPVPGEVVVVSAHGRYRRGVVTSVGRLKAQVHLTTPGAIEEFKTQRYSARSGLHRTRPFVQFTLIAGATGASEMVDGTFGELASVDPVAQARYEDSQEYHRKLTVEAKQLAGPAPKTSDEAGSAPTVTADSTGSAVVMVLEEVWDAIRQNHLELPPVVIVTGSGFMGKPKWGHFRRDGWQHRELSDTHLGEMFVAGETLARGAAYTVETMLHEATHVLARVRGLQDTSRQGRWHNGVFQKLAEELGLEYRQAKTHPQFGYSEMLLTPGTLEEYGQVIAQLEQALRLHVALPQALAALAGEEGKGSSGEHIHHGGRGPRQPGAGAVSNNIKAVCECPTPRIIRASRKVLEQGDIVCGKCRAAFEPEASKFEPTDEDS